MADCIVKTVIPFRFIQTIDMARDILASTKEEIDMSDDEFIFVSDSNNVCRLKTDDTLFTEAMVDFIKYFTLKKFYIIHTVLKAVEQRLSVSKFIRIYRIYFAAVSIIDTKRDRALVINRKPVPVAEFYRTVLNN